MNYTVQKFYTRVIFNNPCLTGRPPVPVRTGVGMLNVQFRNL